MKNKIKALIFDLDGVIVSTEHNHFLAWKKTADQLGIPFNHSENEQLKGLSRVDSLKAILALKNVWITEDEFVHLMDAKNAFYLDSIQELNESNILSGVRALLDAAKQKGIKLAVGSSSKNAKFILNKLKLEDYFEIVVDGSMVEQPKPHPEVFLKAAKFMGLSPSECIVFEDALSGVQAANDGGFYSIGVGNSEVASKANEYLDDLSTFLLENYA